MLTVHHVDGHGRERFIAVTEFYYVPKGNGGRPGVIFTRCDDAGGPTGFSYGRVELINANGVTVRHIELGAPDEDKSLVA